MSVDDNLKEAAAVGAVAVSVYDRWKAWRKARREAAAKDKIRRLRKEFVANAAKMQEAARRIESKIAEAAKRLPDGDRPFTIEYSDSGPSLRYSTPPPTPRGKK